MEIKKILFVDDEVDLLETAKEIYEKQGFEVQTVDDGIKVEAKLKEYDPDLIMLDIKMPQMDGFKVIETIKKSYIDQKKIIVVSGFLTKKDKKWLDDRKVPYLDKPINFTLLSGLIREQWEEE